MERPADCLERGPARHRFRDLVERRDTARCVNTDHAVATGVQGDIGPLRFGGECVIKEFAFDGVTQRTRQPVGIEPARQEIVGGPRPDHLPCEVLVVVGADRDDGNAGRRPEQIPQRLDAGIAGQLQIEQHRADEALGQTLEGLGQSCHPLHLVEIAVRSRQRLPDRAGADGVPADVEDTMLHKAHL